MNKKAFVAVSYKNKETISAEIRTVSETLRELGIEPVVFVQQHSFSPSQEKEMMNKAFGEIRTCHILIAEVTDKAIGVGVEIGYACGLGIPVIYLRKESADYSTTVGGLAARHIRYHDLEQLKSELGEAIKSLPVTREKRPSVGVAVIVKKDNKILLGRRKGSHGAGSWNFPGGHLEFAESIEDCAQREVREEVGIEIKNIRYGSYTNDLFLVEQKHYVTLFVTADYERGTAMVREPEKCDEWEWFDRNQLPRPLFLPIQNLFRQRTIVNLH